MCLPLEGSPPGSDPASESLPTVGIPEGVFTDLPTNYLPSVESSILPYGQDREVEDKSCGRLGREFETGLDRGYVGLYVVM